MYKANKVIRFITVQNGVFMKNSGGLQIAAPTVIVNLKASVKWFHISVAQQSSAPLPGKGILGFPTQNSRLIQVHTELISLDALVSLINVISRLLYKIMSFLFNFQGSACSLQGYSLTKDICKAEY